MRRAASRRGQDQTQSPLLRLRHGREKLVACAEKWVREEDIEPWARALLVELEALKPADFARRID